MPKLKLGFIGTGSICQECHLPHYAAMPDVEIYAICDIKPDVAKAVAEQYGVKRVFTDYNEMLRLDEVDVVDVCTPNDVHSPAGVAALDAGKHVLVEKPVARTAAEAQALVDAARTSGKKLQVAHCIRFQPGNQALKSFVEAGEMGDIYYARAQAIRRRGIPAWGVFIDKEKQGGGPLVDIGVHALDTTLWLMGFPEPVSATGVTYRKFGDRPDVFNAWGPWDYKNYTVEDFAAGFVRFRNGASLMVEASFAANIGQNIFNATIVGTEGGCEMSPPRMYKERNGTLLDVTPVSLPKVDIYEREITAFLDAIVNDKPVPVPADECLITARIMDAIYESAQSGREVRISQTGGTV
ncbi:MAG: Gfo/Idh/MocA family oxidoreductase [Armatimonadota bacterium]|nr:Gfo/Idh/MocA family oxidoreductase [Armatimonadota bacterium]